MLRLRKLGVCLFSILITGCKTVVTIEGNVTGLPGNTVYLMKKGVSDDPIDSAHVFNNRFRLITKLNKHSAPPLVKLKVNDSIHPAHIEPFYLSDGMQPNDSLFYPHNLFYLERASHFVSGDFKKDPYLILKSGPENAHLFGRDTTPGRIDNDDNNNVARNRQIEQIKKYIKQNTTSFFYLDKITELKLFYSASELKQFYSLFDQKLRNTDRGSELKHYFTYRLKDSLPYFNFKLLDSDDHLSYVLDPNATVTLLSFWASWCVPCKQEIPALRKLYDKYKSKGLQVISISIEKSAEDWKNAMKELNLPWPQFIFPKRNNKNWVLKFDTYVIPETIFLSKDLKQIGKFYGYERNTEKLYDSVLSKHL